MTSVLEGERHRSGPEPGTAERVAALTTAVAHSRGRVDDAILDEVEAVATRAAGRMRLSAKHTVVAIAGATGSGKSSTFNALTGLDLSATGVRRPTTSWATACIWGADDAAEVLDWLGIPPRHQTSRDSMLDTDREGRELDGVVLLDLPDHDSTEVSHHLEVDRLVGKADLMVWVLDPQKYADAAVHERYLQPSAAHADTIVVVLNHLDSVPEQRRASMLDDVRRLLADDGLGTVPVIGISAREGWGVDELRSEVVRRVRDKETTRARVDIDVRGAAERLEVASGTPVGSGPRPTLDEPHVARLREQLAEAAGAPVLLEALEDGTRRRTRRATGWPLTSWIGSAGGDPVRRAGLDLGDDVELSRTVGGRGVRSGAVAVQRSRSDAAVRGLADEVTAPLPTAWREAVRRSVTARSDDLAVGLERSHAGVDLSARVPGWARLVQVLQWLLLLAAVGGAVWWVLGLVGATAQVDVAGVPPGLGLLVGGLVVGLLLALVCRPLASSAARARRDAAAEQVDAAVGEAASVHVATPLRDELQAWAAVSDGLATARA